MVTFDWRKLPPPMATPLALLDCGVMRIRSVMERLMLGTLLICSRFMLVTAPERSERMVLRLEATT